MSTDRVRSNDKQQQRDITDELQRGLIIDENKLEEACRDQPDKFWHVAKALALAVSRRDAAQDALKDEEADTDIEYRATAAKAGEKTTEAEIKNAVRQSKSVRALREQLAEFDRQVNLLEALKESWSQRSYALKELVQLHISSYYGDVDQQNSERILRHRDADRAKNYRRQQSEQ